MECMDPQKSNSVYEDQPNPFFIIEKDTFNFQNLQEFVIDPQLQNEGRFVPRVLEKWICWIPPTSGNFKLNFDGLRVENISALDELLKILTT